MDELELLKEDWKRMEAFLPWFSDEELIEMIREKGSFILSGEQ